MNQDVNIYERLKAAGCELDSHESDLYVRDTPEARAIIEAAEQERGMRYAKSFFTSQLDHKPWIDLYFMNQPFWDAKTKERIR